MRDSLWALGNGMGSSVNLIDPPDSAQTDAKGQQVILEIFQGKQKERTEQDAGPTPRTGDPDRLSNALIEHVKATLHNEMGSRAPPTTAPVA